MQRTLMELIVPGLIGVIIALAGSSTIAVTAAIAAPSWFFGAFKAVSLLPLGLLTWAVFVTYGLALVLPAVALLLAAYRFLTTPSLLGSSAFLAGSLGVVYFLYPVLFNEPSLLTLSRQWWSYGLEFALVLAALVSWAVARFFSRPVAVLSQT